MIYKLTFILKQFLLDILIQQTNLLKTAKIVVLVALFLFAEKYSLGQLYPEPPAGFMAGQAEKLTISNEPGLLFYLSGENEFKADFAAGGQDKPNFLRGVKTIPDGAIGNAFEADDSQLMSYWAPGNIFAQRGTLSFFWRSRYPVGPTPFPIFRVAYADHSSWDMVWLRIDYNGAGFDAFVTDVGLSRTRVSYYLDKFPSSEEWTHIAFSWDETEGVRLYINGELAEKQSTVGKVYDTGLDQFGPHSRIISPYQVQSAYNFMRGGDLDELRIYDRMLSDDNIAGLSKGEIPKQIPNNNRDINNRRWRDAWWNRHGWNLPNKPPPLLTSAKTVIKKIGVHDAFDIKRWTWKANDGIRETTWPGVYNMSRLPGRNDYFVLPDWDCYSMSGQSIKFHLPNEPWNHVEMWGNAWGQLTHENELEYDKTFGVRSKEQVKSYHRLKEEVQGGKIRFDNAIIEEPIGELGVYYVREGAAPGSSESETFSLVPANVESFDKSLKNIVAFIDGRYYPAVERLKMVGINQAAQNQEVISSEQINFMPFIHCLIPYANKPQSGLDGVEIEFPALSVKPTHNGVFPLNIRIKDPLWPMRDLADFSFSIKPDKPYTLYFDTRDRLLPDGHALYITIAGAGSSFSAETLKGAKVRLVYKSKAETIAEHELDRFTQIRDLHSHVVEEHPSSPRLNLYNRFIADHKDLLKANPNHWLAKAYLYAFTRNKKDRPEYEIRECPAGIPKWAFLQTEYLRHVEKIITFYIDNRQISNGEFGGGLSDDDDFTNMFVGSAFMGIEPEKIQESLRIFLEAYYDQDRDSYDASLRQRSLPLFTNGLSTIKADELHSCEEGIEAVGQLMMIDYGNPLYFSRGMEIAKRMLEDVTQIAPDGHRHFRSRNYSGTDFSIEDPWQWSQNYSYLVLQTAYLVARYNGNPALFNMLVEIADGLLAHRDEDGNVYTEIHFNTGEVRGKSGVGRTWPVFMAAYEFTGDNKYLEVIPEKNIKTREFNKDSIVSFYTNQIKEKGVKLYIETEGSTWIDRINRDEPLMQEHRLGGVALVRANHIYQQNYVSWNIIQPATFESLALFLPKANSTNIDIIAYNLEQNSVKADMTLWDIKPGLWRVRQGLDTNDDQQIDTEITERIVYLESSSELDITFESRKNTIINLELSEPAQTDYWERPDLAISRAGIKIEKGEVNVRVYSQGAIGTPETTLELRDANGELIKTAQVPAMKPPLDLIPKWVNIKFNVAVDTDLSGGSVIVDPNNKITQITRKNTVIDW
ncbi:MAG: LamG domain-containing protein [Prolixibacteraceae bacterium]|jgi:hypothetical protein|nr:LamG domain-containing protein [Prolixibacteraceae bacterium]MBT6998053.1 LamG domain-containing protein [Prolixibacteraceae bacterium]MBT7395196.1 LamG domain-containing protein [Prolixibacteraceae bacterium]